jgi:type III pantothenate kinase
MNLVLDFGNTRIKAGLFDKDILKKTFVEYDILTLVDLLKNFKIDQILVATVVELPMETIKEIEKIGKPQFFQATTPTPIRNFYQSVNTLGIDRLAAACGAFQQFKGTAILVIDAGTCIKYNYTDKNGNFLGGGISPGLAMRFKAMHKFTNKLPLTSFDDSYTDLIGNNTQSSIRMGAQLGLLAEVKGIIEQYKQMDEAVNIVLTGGDAAFLQKGLKNGIFADPDLILKGLNSILNYKQ